ncbi:MAG: HD domain-containing protein [Deltaproteobacteria bacterium]|nr:HD domain-containing protein [Deltaproteobacteria bacterium]
MPKRKTESEHLGGRCIRALHHLLNTVQIHQDNNQLVKESSAAFHRVVSLMSEGEDLKIQIWRGRFYIQGEKLLYRKETFPIINEMLEYFPQRGLEGFHFLSPFTDVAPDDLTTFAHLLNDSLIDENPPEWLEKTLKEKGLSWVNALKEQKKEPPSLVLKRKERAKQAYIDAVVTVKEVADKVSHQGAAGVRKARRLAQTMVDLVREDDTLLLGLTTIRDYDDYTYTHSVNVALLCLCLGKRLGLSHIFLEQLAISGLFHDLGKVEVSKDILMKPGTLSGEEWEEMRKHPLTGVRRILWLHASRTLKMRTILGPFEHHLNADLSGYPETHFVQQVSLFGQILHIADTYDALTSERGYRPRTFTPDEALRMMWAEAGKKFDALLLKSFINMMGLYPIGTILELDSGEMGLVVDYPDESERTRPLIMLLADDGKGGYTRGETVDLAAEELKKGTTAREILRGIHPSSLGIQPSLFFLEDVN